VLEHVGEHAQAGEFSIHERHETPFVLPPELSAQFL
jgi:hypothetical protein